MDRRRIPRKIIDTSWRPTLAYAVGLLAADGCLVKDGLQIQFISRDLQLMNSYRNALGISKPSRKRPRGGETQKKYFAIYFKSKQFHAWLRDIGITPAKSKTIKSVDVPDRFFADFLRGLYDGDGTFWSYWDKRWPRSYVFHIEIASASEQFILWLQEKLSRLYHVKGHVKLGDGVHIVRYAKGDSRKLFNTMYYQSDLLLLNRKYRKMKSALDFDERLRQSRKMPR